MRVLLGGLPPRLARAAEPGEALAHRHRHEVVERQLEDPALDGVVQRRHPGMPANLLAEDDRATRIDHPADEGALAGVLGRDADAAKVLQDVAGQLSDESWYSTQSVAY